VGSLCWWLCPNFLKTLILFFLCCFTLKAATGDENTRPCGLASRLRYQNMAQFGQSTLAEFSDTFWSDWGSATCFLKIVFLMTHLAIFWYLKREASLARQMRLTEHGDDTASGIPRSRCIETYACTHQHR
jgi:hypothetical protein